MVLRISLLTFNKLELNSVIHQLFPRHILGVSFRMVDAQGNFARGRTLFSHLNPSVYAVNATFNNKKTPPQPSAVFA